MTKSTLDQNLVGKGGNQIRLGSTLFSFLGEIFVILFINGQFLNFFNKEKHAIFLFFGIGSLP